MTDAMKKVLLALCLACAQSVPAQTPQPQIPQPAPIAVPVPGAPSLSAKSYVLTDFVSGQVLVGNNEHMRVEPASITKEMSSYVLFKEIDAGRLKLDDMITISEKAWRTEGSRMFVEVGKQVKAEDLLMGMIIQSGNDATVALAEHVAGSEETFAAMMNDYAGKIGMKASHFMNATGLPHPEHYTTAHDIALLARAMISEFPEHYKWHSVKEYTFNGIRQHNRNSLLWRDPTVDGIKTGHTESAGFCLLASAKRGEMRLISAVMGTPSEKQRSDDTQALLNYGFRFFETHHLYKPGDELAKADLWKGEQNVAAVGVDRDVFITIPRGQYEKLKFSLEMPGLLVAPYAKGHVLGNVRVRLDDKEIVSLPVVTLEDVAEGGFWKRLSDSVLLWFEDEPEA